MKTSLHSLDRAPKDATGSEMPSQTTQTLLWWSPGLSPSHQNDSEGFNHYRLIDKIKLSWQASPFICPVSLNSSMNTEGLRPRESTPSHNPSESVQSRDTVRSLAPNLVAPQQTVYKGLAGHTTKYVPLWPAPHIHFVWIKDFSWLLLYPDRLGN